MFVSRVTLSITSADFSDSVLKGALDLLIGHTPAAEFALASQPVESAPGQFSLKGFSCQLIDGFALSPCGCPGRQTHYAG